MEVSVDKLKSNGFIFIEGFFFYQKLEADTSYWYSCRYTEDPVLTRVVNIQNWQLQDSTMLSNWVESNGGTIVSSFYKQKSLSEFFVKGKTSGLISKCSLLTNHLQIQFEYPDVGNIKRSIYRDHESGEVSYEYEGRHVGKGARKPDK